MSTTRLDFAKLDFDLDFAKLDKFLGPVTFLSENVIPTPKPNHTHNFSLKS